MDLIKITAINDSKSNNFKNEFDKTFIPHEIIGKQIINMSKVLEPKDSQQFIHPFALSQQRIEQEAQLIQQSLFQNQKLNYRPYNNQQIKQKSIDLSIQKEILQSYKSKEQMLAIKTKQQERVKQIYTFVGITKYSLDAEDRQNYKMILTQQYHKKQSSHNLQRQKLQQHWKKVSNKAKIWEQTHINYEVFDKFKQNQNDKIIFFQYKGQQKCLKNHKGLWILIQSQQRIQMEKKIYLQSLQQIKNQSNKQKLPQILNETEIREMKDIYQRFIKEIQEKQKNI